MQVPYTRQDQWGKTHIIDGKQPKTHEQLARTAKYTQAVGNVLGVGIVVGVLFAVYKVLGSLFAFLVVSGLGLWGCWGITLLVGLFALSLIARIIVNIAG